MSKKSSSSITSSDDIRNPDDALQFLANKAVGHKPFGSDFAREEFPKDLTAALEKLPNPTDRAIVTEGLLDKNNKRLFGRYKDIVEPIHQENLHAQGREARPVRKGLEGQIKEARVDQSKVRKAEQERTAETKTVTSIEKEDLGEQFNRSKEYRQLTTKHRLEPKGNMKTILGMEDTLTNVVTKGEASIEDKRSLRNSIITLAGDDPALKKLVNKHIGGILREEMKKMDSVKVESSFKNRVGDFFRSSDDRKKAREALKNVGIDVEALVSGMKAKSGPDKKVSMAAATSAGKKQEQSKGAGRGG